MNRRDAIGVLICATAASLCAKAQSPGKARRVGVLMGYSEADSAVQGLLAVFKRSLAERGWTEGQNLQMDIRWSGADVNRASELAKEIMSLHPELIVATSTPATAAAQRETKTIPIVFMIVSDPVGSRFGRTLSRPGGKDRKSVV